MNPFFVVSFYKGSYNESMKKTLKITIKTFNESKVGKILWPLAYFVLIVLLCFSGVIFFHNYYYTSIFVSGTSMQPTLNEQYKDVKLGYDTVEYGIVDSHKHAIDDIKRFDIITTYFPWSSSDYKNGYYVPGQETDGYSPCYKIKRVLGMPGDTIQIVNSHIIINGIDYHEANNKDETHQVLPFTRKFEKEETEFNTSGEIVLGEGRYWVQGDHWGGSTDCLNTSALPYGCNYDGKGIYYDNITGVLVAIEGIGKLTTVYHCDKCNVDYKKSGLCEKCGATLSKKETVTEKQSIPKRYYL